MPSPRKPWTASIYEQLADRAWHPRGDVLAEAARHVPPGVAARMAEHQRLRRRANPGERVHLRGDPIAIGAHQVAQRTLIDLVRRRRVEINPERTAVRLPQPRSNP